jgi:hypothetical protein
MSTENKMKSDKILIVCHHIILPQKNPLHSYASSHHSEGPPSFFLTSPSPKKHLLHFGTATIALSICHHSSIAWKNIVTHHH